MDDVKIDHFIKEIHNSCDEIATLLDNKNRAYGNSIVIAPEIFKILFPNGIPYNKIDDALIMVRILDKFSRIARGDTERVPNEDAKKDVCGYAILWYTLDRMSTKD